jgi:transketolase
MIGELLKMDEIKNLKLKANNIRRDIMEMAFKGHGPFHIGSSMSCTDIITALYFKFMRIRPDNPTWEERDRFILSKGHAAPTLFAVLSEAGFFSKELLSTMLCLGSKLEAHPVYPKTPGVDMSTGSLGNGLSLGVGMAMGLKLKEKQAKVFVIVGDGETQEGLIWEAALYASKARLGNLVAIVDNNHYQSCGSTEQIMPVEPIADKWRAFGWYTLEINGNDMSDIVSNIEIACMYREQPTLILANTIKGKGVSFMENNNEWHFKTPNESEYFKALQELEQTAGLFV